MAAELGETKDSASAPQDRDGAAMRTPSHGHGRLRVGNPDASGGRQRLVFRDTLRDILRDPAVEAALRAVLTDPDNRNFAATWKHVAERAFGPVVQKVKLRGQHEVRGVILLPAQSWGAPAASPAPAAPVAQVPDGTSRALPAPDPAADPAALAAAAVPLSPALLASIADTVTAAVLGAATDTDDDQ